MELLLDKKKSEYMHCFDKGSAIHEEATEIIVSDKSPDIEHIVKGVGNVFIKSKDVRDGKISVEGTIKGVVLYIASEEKCPRKLDVSIPFFHTFESDGVTPDSKVLVKAVVRSFDVREMNPRKVSVRASIELTYRAYNLCEEEICRGVIGAEKYGVEEKYTNINDYRPIIIKEKSFSVNDDIELSGKDTELSGILTSGVLLVPGEMKVIGNKAIVKGVCEVNYIYTTEDGVLHSAEHELPFSHILDIDGMEDGHNLEISLEVSGYDLDVSYDASGKARYITVSVTADISALVCERTETKALCDAYSTSCDAEVSRMEFRSARYIDKTEKRVPHSETLQLQNGVKKVLDVSVLPQLPVRRRENGSEVISSDVVISVMYISEDDLLYTASRRACIVCPVEIKENRDYAVATSVRGKGYSQGNDKELNVRFFMDFEVTETENEKTSLVCKVETSEETGDKTRTPSICVMRVSEKCDIWSVAKKHRTRAKEICLANGIENEEYVDKGRVLLIPKCR